MVTALLLAFSQTVLPTIKRDAYGVPHVIATSYQSAFEGDGYAVAQDRLWQMELSRRLARGKLSEVLGSGSVASDREILQTGYTDQELQRQFDRLSARAQTALRAYVHGVNLWIDQSVKNGLPDGFIRAGCKPEPWTVLDSTAICIHLLQQFGRGGAGELRNMAALAYLKSQKSIAGRALDVWDDLAWANDPEAIPTVDVRDDPLATRHYSFYQPDREATEAHLALLPKLGLLELLGGIKLSAREVSTRVAENLAVPFRTGSYCVVVSPSHSASGHPLLLSGPQMGLKAPSIVHEVAVDAPGISMVGMDVPGVPGVIIGNTPTFAWGITSGVADTCDTFFYPSVGNAYRVGNRTLPIQTIKFDLRVHGARNQEVDQLRTVDGPIILKSKGTRTVFALKSSFWMHEMDSFEAWVRLWSANSAPSIERAMDRTSMNFNFFYATVQGDIGWKYLGLVPKRTVGMDPRFPTPGDPRYAWRGFLSPSEMPHVRNPKVGYLANWNNKPVAWWPNFDTPAWGKIFDNASLLRSIAKPKLSTKDLQGVPEAIAQADETWPYFKSYLLGRPLYSFDGRLLDGSLDAANYRAFLDSLRVTLFADKTGNFLNNDFFKIVVQPSVVFRALEGKTKFDYLAGRSVAEVVDTAMRSVTGSPVKPYKANSFRTFDATPILYSNRGTYIQIIELLKGQVQGVNVFPPGIAESGPHRNDQSVLAREWKYKEMTRLGR